MLQAPKLVGPVPTDIDVAPRQDGWPCPHCLTAHQSGAKFCPVCGAPLTKPPAAVDATRAAPAETPTAAALAAAPTPPAGPAGKVGAQTVGDPAGRSAQPPSQSPPATCTCGYAQPPDAQYCPQCGKRFEGTNQPSHRLSGRSTAGKLYSVPLTGPECMIGKNADCTVIVPEDDYLSHLHAKITVKDGQILLEDLGSANGTFLRVRRPVVLEPGDEVLVGTSLFRLEKQGT
ncbi:MAG TPA: FHA domain-containing protein [Phycisphaerae bacterium]|nr:FHA domain-containing protein [Phycisphaerae bacterium]